MILRPDENIKETVPKRLAILADLPRHGFGDVDLVFINVEDVVLGSEAVRQSKLIYSDGMHTARRVKQYLNARG